MKKIVLVPDSFKGTVDAFEICEIMKEAILETYSDCEIISIPVADGGEGSVNCFLKALKGEKIFTTVKGPYFEEMQAFYGIIENDRTAVIEMSACAGLPLVDDNKNPCLTTTYGVGQLMEHALINGCTTIILGLGGSCTNDGGCGAAAALGVKFYDSESKEFIPTGGTLKNIERIDVSQMNFLLKGTRIITMCDVDNLMYGRDGAAYIFAPQKGADDAMVQILDDGLQHLCEVIKSDLKIDLSLLKGAGAAGGMGAGMVAFFNTKLQSGIQTVLETVDFDFVIRDADIIFTGEGKIDNQSLQGKVVMGVAKQAKKQNVPVVAIVGDIGENIEQIYKEGISAVFSINRVALPFEKACQRSKMDLSATMKDVIKLIHAVCK